jgi:hypothetical protein
MLKGLISDYRKPMPIGRFAGNQKMERAVNAFNN